MAEISQKLVTCPNGHLYDSNKHASCPICQNQGAGGFSRTVDVNAGAASGQFSQTIDPFSSGSIPGGGNAPSFGVTAPPSGARPFERTTTFDPATPEGAPSPVVGWLVAVEGPNRGADYRIHVGYNYIGRERGDIRIGGDMSISGEKDSNITFVPQTNKFYIAHEQGKNVLLVNDIPAIGNGIELHNYDRVTIGNTKLLFVGLCGDQFSWGEKRENQHV